MKLDEIRKLCKAATPGPWEWDYAKPGWLLGSSPETLDDHTRIIHAVLDGIADEQDCNVSAKDADREFIAAARDLVPKLLAVAEAAKDYRDGVYDVSLNRVWSALGELEGEG